MTNVPGYLARIPVVAPLARREMREYTRRNGRPADFTKGWWRPPVGPRTVLDSETAQIAGVLGLRPLVSITDHDSIEACLDLRSGVAPSSVPISLEWTVPYEHSFVHLGVHNLGVEWAVELFAAMSGYTRAPEGCLAELLERIERDPETLVVLNHPLWDLPGIGAANHMGLLRRFLSDHGDRVHAFELNGYRSWRENTSVMALAAARSRPVIAGGDRHGCEPNSLLNLTAAESFGAFVREVREHRQSVVVVMPQYRHSLVARKLRVAADAMRQSSTYPQGQQRWTDRVSYESQGVVQRLSERWPTGGPFWVRSAVGLFRFGTSAPLLPLLLALVWLAGAATPDRGGPSSFMEDDDSAPQASSSYGELTE